MPVDCLSSSDCRDGGEMQFDKKAIGRKGFKEGWSSETTSLLGVGGGHLSGYAFLHRLQTSIEEDTIMLSTSSMGKIGLFVGGVLFGTAGIRLLSSKDAKKAYAHCTAAALRARESVMKTATIVQENAEDILAEARQINEKRACEEQKEDPLVQA